MSDDDIKIIDNFLDKEDFKTLQNFIYGNKLQWYRSPVTEMSENSLQFVHVFFDNNFANQYLSLLNRCFEKLNILINKEY